VVETTTNLKVSLASGPPTGPDVRIKQENWDHAKAHKDQRTSLRFFGANPRGELKPRRFSIDSGDGRYFTRDRDLGQSFTTPAGGSFRVEAITLRTGPADLAVGSNAHGAGVSRTGTPSSVMTATAVALYRRSSASVRSKSAPRRACRSSRMGVVSAKTSAASLASRMRATIRRRFSV
jgi:hypothetical protein